MLVDEGVVQDFDCERSNDTSDAPLEEQCADDEDWGEEGVEEFRAIGGNDPGEGSEGG